MMVKGNHSKSGDEWENFDQLRKSIVKQNVILELQRGGSQFDPHKYFGGWDWVERTSIEKLTWDKRLLEMMEYDSSNASCLSKCQSSSIISDSLTSHSVAEELEVSSPIQK